METLELEAPVAKATATVDPVTCDFFWDTRSNHAPSGWHPTLIPAFDPGSSFHVAHDTLEHLSHTDASLEAEMRAFGANIFLRGITPYWPMKTELIHRHDPLQALFDSIDGEDHDSAAKHMVSDVFSFLSENSHALVAPDIKPARIDAEAERILKELVAEAHQRGGSVLRGSHNAAHQKWSERIEIALDWMRIGYRAHAERFSGVSPKSRASAFLTIEKIVNKITVTDRRYNRLQHGDTLRVEVCFTEQPEVRVTMHSASVGDYSLVMPFGN